MIREKSGTGHLPSRPPASISLAVPTALPCDCSHDQTLLLIRGGTVEPNPASPCAARRPSPGGVHRDHRLAFAADGSLWVLQFATQPGLTGPGALIRVDPDGTRTTVASDGLLAPTSVALGPGGALDVSNWCLPGRGTVPLQRPRAAYRALKGPSAAHAAIAATTIRRAHVFSAQVGRPRRATTKRAAVPRSVRVAGTASSRNPQSRAKRPVRGSYWKQRKRTRPGSG